MYIRVELRALETKYLKIVYKEDQNLSIKAGKELEIEN